MEIAAVYVAEFDFARYQLLPITLCASYIGVCSLRLVRCPRFFLSWGSAFPRCGNTDGYQGCKFSLLQIKHGYARLGTALPRWDGYHEWVACRSTCSAQRLRLCPVCAAALSAAAWTTGLTRSMRRPDAGFSGACPNFSQAAR